MNLMNGQHYVVHFFRGRDTPAGDVIRDLFRLLQLSKAYHSLFALWISSSHLGETGGLLICKVLTTDLSIQNCRLETLTNL